MRGIRSSGQFTTTIRFAQTWHGVDADSRTPGSPSKREPPTTVRDCRKGRATAAGPDADPALVPHIKQQPVGWFSALKTTLLV
jgi:hypothetical protein